MTVRLLRLTSLVASLLFALSPGTSFAAFDAERAFADLKDIVRIGPRPAGSEAAERTSTSASMRFVAFALASVRAR
jgi:hypothetical protein